VYAHFKRSSGRPEFMMERQRELFYTIEVLKRRARDAVRRCSSFFFGEKEEFDALCV